MPFQNWPYSDLGNINLTWILERVKEAWTAAHNAEEVAENLKTFVNEYFDNLDVQQEINNKIDRMVIDGSFESVLLNFVPAIIDAWLAENIDNPASPPLDATLTLVNAAAQSKATGDRLAAIRDALIPHSTYDVIADLWAAANGTHNNATFTWNGKVCTVSSPGVTSGPAVNNIITPFQTLPETLIPGRSYPFTYETTNPNIQLGFVFYDNQSNPEYVYRTSSGNVTIPANAVAWSLRLLCASGVNPNGTVSNITLLTGLPLSEVVERYIYGNKDRTKNTPAGLTYFHGITGYTSDNRLTPADMPPNSYLYSNGNRLSPEFMAADGSFFWVLCLQNMYAPLVRQYIVFNRASGFVATGWTTDGGNTSTWTSIADAKKSLRVLVIGSSFGQDCSVYSPWIMEEMADNVAVTMGNVYMSGGTINDYNTWFDGTQTLNFFKRSAGAAAWARLSTENSSTGMTLKQCLSNERWDVILVNQSAADGADYSTFSNMLPYIVKMAAYVGHNVKFGYLMPQKAIGYSYTYDALAAIARQVYTNYPVSFIVPAGAAIEKARGTTLDSLGDAGHLCYDSAVGHLQEGLPVLIANYVTAAVLLQVAGLGMQGIYGSRISPTAEWVTSHAIPGTNGSSTGLVGDNKLLGQRCAIAGMKEFNGYY